ncbi:MAG: hypothetical protein ACFB6R_05830 [Alphaproteobacteria bacterium]
MLEHLIEATYCPDRRAPLKAANLGLEKLRHPIPDGVRRLPEANIARFRGRLRAMRDRVRAGTLTEAEARPRIQAWQAHAGFAHTRKLRNAVLGEKRAGGKRKPG